MKKPLFHSLFAIVLLFAQQSSRAEDIDLFVGRAAGTNSTPNVLFILDSTGNWSTPFTAEIAALKGTFDAMAVNADGTAKFNVGIMMFAESPRKGGYVRAAIRPMNATNKGLYSALINSLDKNVDQGADALYAYTMAEAYRYFGGMQGVIGPLEPKRDYHNNNIDKRPKTYPASNNVYALSGNAFTDAADQIYDKPATVVDCAYNYIIYISNGKVDSSDKEGTSPQCSASDLTKCTAQDLLTLAGGDIARIPINPSGEANNMSDEWARFMRTSPLGVRTFTIDVGTPDAAHTALLKSMATVSEGHYFSAAATTTDITNAIQDALTMIQSVNSVFASVTLPVAVGTTENFRNQVFIGMFRPDANAFPRWFGNLKQYRVGKNADKALDLLDASATSAINEDNGFIADCARSYWTPGAGDELSPGEWASMPVLNCKDLPNSGPYNYPDGPMVQKGAQAYMLRKDTARTVKTCSTTGASCGSLVDFNTINSTPTQLDLGAGSSGERNALINWAIGIDVDDQNGDGITTGQMRLSEHGDVVHARPAAVAFGTTTDPQVVVFYGGNDGMLRAVNGNRTDLTDVTSTIGSKIAGSELWAFMPPEFYKNIKRLRDNTTQISFPGNTDGTPTPLPKPYGIDGPIVAFKDTNKTFIYTPMRRGGRAMYAFSMASATASPALEWKIGCGDNFSGYGVTVDTNCKSGWTSIGQTWSAPTLLTATGYPGTGTPNPLLIFGGGYDTCHDVDSSGGCASPAKGNKIYLVDARTGTQVQTFDTDNSVIADLTVVRDENGRASYVYAADLGGSVYRISGDSGAPIGAKPPATSGGWTITKIASLGGTGTDNRKFMFAPDVVSVNGGYAILLGSGDREKPLLGYSYAAAVNNYFFMLQDMPGVNNWLVNGCGPSTTYLCLTSLTPITGASPDAASVSPKGWYLSLKNNEQVVTSAITVFNTVTFSTHRPSGSTPPEPGAKAIAACGNDLGTAKSYSVNYANAAPAGGATSRSQLITGGGLPPSPVSGMLTLDDGSTVPFLFGAGPIPLRPTEPTPLSNLTRPKGRVYWNIQK